MTEAACEPSAQRGRGRLTRTEVLSAALRIIDRDGLERLNMRALGQEVGVQAMSVYHYVSGKDEVLDGVVELIYDDLVLPSAAEGWQATLKSGFLAFRSLLLAHPAAVPLFATRSVSSPEALAFIERSLRTLRGAGFDDIGAIDGHRVLMSFTIGYVMSEVSLLGTSTVDPNSWGTAAYALRDLSAEEVPNLAEVAAKALARRADEQVVACLDTILAGLENQIS